jgi:signal transduction histidine kinase
MTAMQADAIVMFVMFVLGLILGWGLRDWQQRKLEAEKVLAERERPRNQLLSTQKNIFGQINNALGGAVYNHKWVNYLKFKTNLDQNPVSLVVLDRRTGFPPKPVVLAIMVGCDFRCMDVRVAVIGGEILYTKSPNDPNLGLLIGKQVEFLQKWTPAV